MSRQSVEQQSPHALQFAKELGALLLHARKTAGMTQQEVAEGAKLSMSVVSKFEGGRSKEPAMFTVASMASAIKRELDDVDAERFGAQLQSLMLGLAEGH